MSNHTAAYTFPVGEAIAEHEVVKLAAGVLNQCDATDEPMGVALQTAFSTTNPPNIQVALLNAGGVVHVKAAGSFAANATLYCAANGTVDDADGGGANTAIGTAIDASTGTGDIVRMLPNR